MEKLYLLRMANTTKFFIFLLLLVGGNNHIFGQSQTGLKIMIKEGRSAFIDKNYNGCISKMKEVRQILRRPMPIVEYWAAKAYYEKGDYVSCRKSIKIYWIGNSENETWDKELQELESKARLKVNAQKAWYRAKRRHTIAGYKDFLSRYGKSNFASKAKQKLKELERAWERKKDNAKKEFYQEVEKRDDKEAYATYLKIYGSSGSLGKKASREKDERENPTKYLKEEINSISLSRTKELVGYGADIYTTSNRRPLLFHTISNDNKSVMNYLINKGVSINRTDDKGNDALMWAASKGKYSTVKLLLEKGASVKKTNNNRESALYIAFSKNNFNITSLLLANKANPHFSYLGQPVLSYCITHNKNDFGLKFIRYSQLSRIDQGTSSPLCLSVKNKNIRLTNALISKGANPNKVVESKSLLMWATESSDVNLLKTLLASDKIDMNLITGGITPLQYSIYKNKYDMFLAFINNSVDISTQSAHGWTALHFAARSGNIEICKMLLQNGADVNIKDEWKRKAKHVAKERKQKAILKLLRTQ